MFEKLYEMVMSAERIGVFTHEHPDGDALGSSFAFALGLLGLGKSVKVFLGDFGGEIKEYSLIRGKDTMSDTDPEECDLKIAFDCADFSRISLGGAEFSGKTAAVDHHVTHIPYAEETIVIDAPATGQIVFDILTEWEAPITPEIADNLYLAIACDTGNFKYPSTQPKTHEIAAELIRCGASFAHISREIFYRHSKGYYDLLKIALERLEIFGDGKVCMMYLSDEDFKKAGISDEQSGDIVTLPTRIEGVETGCFIRRRGKGFKVSLRSNEYVDVAKIAAAFGGGGHIRAAGFNSDLSLEDLTAKIKEKLIGAV